MFSLYYYIPDMCFFSVSRKKSIEWRRFLEKRSKHFLFSSSPAAPHHNNGRQPSHVMSNRSPFSAHLTLTVPSQPLPHNLLIPHIKSQIPSKSTPLFGLISVFKSTQAEPKTQPGQLGFKEPRWTAAKIPHTAQIATAYSEIMIQTMQQVSKEYQVPLSRRFLLGSINTYAL